MFARHSRGPTHFAFAAASSVAAHLDHGGRGAGVKGDTCLRVLRQVGNGCHLSPAGLDEFGERRLEVCRSKVWVHVCGRMRTDAFDDHHISATRWHDCSRAILSKLYQARHVNAVSFCCPLSLVYQVLQRLSSGAQRWPPAPSWTPSA